MKNKRGFIKHKKVVIMIILLLIAIELIIVMFQQGKVEERNGLFSSKQDISINVLPPLPILTIISPESKTYSDSVIFLDYTLKNEADKIWYNLNNGKNITITTPVYLTVSDGSYILSLFAENMYGETLKELTFSVLIPESPVPSKQKSSSSGGSFLPPEKSIEINITDNLDIELETKDQVRPGKFLEAKITIYNVTENKIPAILEYIIKDQNKNIIVYEKETLEIFEETILKKTFQIPENAGYGSYTFEVKAEYDQEIKTEETGFYVTDTIYPEKQSLTWIIIFLALMIITIIIILLLIKEKPSKRKKKKR